MKKIKLRPESKKPSGSSWIVSDDPEQIDLWISQRHNVGLLTGEPNGIVVFDFDDKDKARDFFRKMQEIIRTIVETRHGCHFHFSGSGPGRKTEWGDFKGDGGYVLFPPSTVKFDDGPWTYRFVKGHEFTEDLCPFPESWVKVAQERRTTRKEVRHALSYISHIHAISGQHGHNATFRAACVLRDSGMDEAEALAALVEWNRTNAEPPWETKDLLKKVRDAYAKVPN